MPNTVGNMFDAPDKQVSSQEKLVSLVQFGP